MRIVAGRLGGRRLVAPRGRATRPTSDRVREALFSALGDVTGSAVLDLWAGTGALGIEALSRGARLAVFVENARPALAALRDNLAALRLDPVSRVVAMPVTRALPALAHEGPFDLVLADPPYDSIGEVPTVLAELVRAGALGPDARAVVEHASRDVAPDVSGLIFESTRRYGDTAVSRYIVGGPDDG